MYVLGAARRRWRRFSSDPPTHDAGAVEGRLCCLRAPITVPVAGKCFSGHDSRVLPVSKLGVKG